MKGEVTYLYAGGLVSKELAEKVLKYLMLSAGDYVSGTEIARRLGISRVMVNKAIESLRRVGYVIESHPKRGYKLLCIDDLSMVNTYIADLRTRVKFIAHYVPECTSTQDIAKSLAESGAPEGLIVIADEMSRGRGRLGRVWYASRGGLWFSIILRPKLLKSLQLLSLSTGLALVKALRDLFDIEAMLKWPNDVIYRDRKLAGILIEASAELDRVNYVVVGVGINVNNELPKEIEHIAVSLKQILGREVPRIHVLKAFLTKFDKVYVSLLRGSTESILSELRTYMGTLGKRVRVIFLSGEVEGEAIDIDNFGRLILMTKSGRRRTIEAGDVIHLR